MNPSQIPDSKWDIYEKLYNSSSVLGSGSDFVTMPFSNMQQWRLELTEILALRCPKSRSALSALLSAVLPVRDGISWSPKGCVSMDLHKHKQVNTHQLFHSWGRRTKHSLAAAGPKLCSLRCALVFPHSHFPLKIPGQQLCLKSLNLGKLELNEAVITSEHICLSQQLLRKRDHYLYFKTHSTTFKMLTCEEKSHFPWVMVQTEELFVCFFNHQCKPQSFLLRVQGCRWKHPGAVTFQWLKSL